MPVIRNAWGVVHEVVNFFRASAMRKDAHQLCDTRWVERHDALITFARLYVNIVNTLETISTTWKNPCNAPTLLSVGLRNYYIL